MKVRTSLSKPVKRVAANILDPHLRGEFIRMMFKAELTPLSTPKSKNIKTRDNNEVDS
jgi:hypothetical protein